MPLPAVRSFTLTIIFILNNTLLAALSHGQPVAPVTVMLPQQSALQQQIQLSGTVRAVKRANLSSLVDGAVAEVLVDVGSRVEAGETLIQLDQRLAIYEKQRLEATLAAARAQANEAARLVKEAEQLSKSQHLPATELALRRAAAASAQAAFEAAKAELALQTQRIAFHQITAPFSAVVVERFSEIGEWVTRGTPVLELVASDKVYLDVQVPQEQYSSIRSDSEITIRPDTQPDQVLKAEIAAMVPVADSASRSFRLRLVSPQHGGLLLPGSSASATFTSKQQDSSVLIVSRDALLRNPDNSFALFVIAQQGEQSFAQRRQVKVGRILGSSVEILSGLAAEEAVVIRGNEVLRNEQKVSVQTREQDHPK